MSFLILLAYCFVWGVIAWLLAKVITSSIGNQLRRRILQVFLFGIIFVSPIADEIIGRNQFAELCTKDVAIVLSPHWQEVKKAKGLDGSHQDLLGYAVPIYKTHFTYIDLDTGKPFLTSIRLGRQGGFIFRRMGVGEVNSCKPANESEIYKNINIDQLIQNGSAR